MIKYTIIKETSKNNKRMKWHLVGISENGGIHSEWYKTSKDAEHGQYHFETQVPYKYSTL